MRFLDLLRSAFRSLRRRPGFALPVMSSLALGVAAVAAAGILVLPVFGPVPRLESVADGGIGALTGARTAGSYQAAAFAELLETAVVLAAAVLLVGGASAGLPAAGRTAARRGVRAVRSALGATPGSLRLHEATEWGLLAGAGILLGVPAGVGGGILLRRLWPQGLGPDPVLLSRGVWLPGAAALALLAGVATVAILAAPAGADLREATGEGSRVVGGGPATFVRGLLSGAQIALSLSVLAAAGALLLSAGLGSDDGGGSVRAFLDTAAVEVDLPAAVAGDPDTAASVEAILAAARRLPGVEGATAATPGTWFGLGTVDDALTHCGLCSHGGLFLPLTAPAVRHHAVAPGFFRESGIALVAGRGFDAADDAGGAPVAVVGAEYAARRFEDGDPIGREVQVGGSGGAWHTVVGVVEDVAPRGIGSARLPALALYLPLAQASPRTFDIALTAAEDPGALEEEALSLIAEAGLPGARTRFTTLPRELERLRAPLRWAGLLLAVFGLAALLLALSGVAWSTREEVMAARKELGVRLALGARPPGLVGFVVRRIAGRVGWGLAIGVLFALGAVARVAETTQELGTGELLPVVAVLAVLLGAAALVGALPPAISAAGTDPAASLRER